MKSLHPGVTGSRLKSIMESRIRARIGFALFLGACSAAGASAANISAMRDAHEHSAVLANVQSELTRLGFGFVLAPLPTSTTSHIYARPLWATNHKDELWCALMD